jgi:hypothetical protein
VSRDHDQLTQLRTKLAAEPIDKMEQALARLPDAAARFDASDIDGGKAILADVEAGWPGSEAVARWKLDQAAAALKDGRNAIAAALMGNGPDWPRVTRLRTALAAAGTPVVAVASVPVIAPASPDAGDNGEVKKHDASRAAWGKAVESGRHGQVADAWTSFQEARELWPDNPVVNDSIFYGQVGGGVIAMFLIGWLWKRRSD